MRRSFRLPLRPLAAAVILVSAISTAACAPAATDASYSPLPSTSASTTPEVTAPPNTSTPSTDANDPDDGVARDPSVATPTPGTTNVEVIITRTSTSVPLEIGGGVDGLIESDATCTLIAQRGDVKLTASGPGTPNSAGTDCGDGLTLSDSRLSSGAWTLSLQYASPRVSGQSETLTWTAQ